MFRYSNTLEVGILNNVTNSSFCMKKIIYLVVLVLLFGTFTSATFYLGSPILDCDVITMKDGKDIEAKVLEISTTEIKYKNCGNLEGPTISVLRKEVFSIKYANGTKEIITTTNDGTNRKVEGLSLTSMILGILGFGPLPLIFGAIGLSKINKNPEKWSGKGFALAGLVLGILWTVVIIIYLI